jgi:phosphatidylinositol alpha-1,6-mannosyltransferase
MARYHADLARGLGADCDVAVGRWEGSPPVGRGEHGVVALPFEARAAHRPWNLLRTAAAVRAHGQRAEPEVVIAGGLRPLGPLAGRLARSLRARLVQIHHGGDLLQTARRWRRHRIGRARWRRLLSAPDLHAVNSRYTAGLARRLGIVPERIVVVAPEVDTAHFVPAASLEARRALRRGRGWDDDAIVTLFVGRLVERKGLEDLLVALATLPEQIRLVVAGPGDRGRWQQEGRRAGVADRVELLGPVDHETLPALYAAADLLVLPARDAEAEADPETFGIVCLEAAACGLPVLATRTGGIPEAVDDERSGLLVDPDDPRALAAAWRRLADDGGLRRALGLGGVRGPALRHGAGSSARALVQALQERGLVRGA